MASMFGQATVEVLFASTASCPKYQNLVDDLLILFRKEDY